jgi:hypothetical protein
MSEPLLNDTPLPVVEVWQECRRIVRAITGLDGNRAGLAIGAWCKQARENPRLVLEVLREAETVKPAGALHDWMCAAIAHRLRPSVTA